MVPFPGYPTHYGLELLAALLSVGFPRFDSLDFMLITRVLGVYNTITYAVLLFGIISQLCQKGNRWLHLCLYYFCLYYGGCILLSFWMHGSASIDWMFDMRNIPKSELLRGWVNPFTRGNTSDSLVVAFRLTSYSLKHLPVIALPVLLLVVTRALTTNVRISARKEIALLLFLATMVSSVALIAEEIVCYFLPVSFLFLLVYGRGCYPSRRLVLWSSAYVLLVVLLVVCQGGTISNILLWAGDEFSHQGTGKLSVLFKMTGDRYFYLSSLPAIPSYGYGRISLADFPLVVRDLGIGIFALIPVSVLFTVRFFRGGKLDEGRLLDLYLVIALLGLLVTLFVRHSSDFLCERFYKIEYGALALAILFVFVSDKMQTYKLARVRVLVVSLSVILMLLVTSRSWLYFVSTLTVEQGSYEEYQERIDDYTK